MCPLFCATLTRIVRVDAPSVTTQDKEEVHPIVNKEEKELTRKSVPCVVKTLVFQWTRSPTSFLPVEPKHSEAGAARQKGNGHSRPRVGPPQVSGNMANL